MKVQHSTFSSFETFETDSLLLHIAPFLRNLLGRSRYQRILDHSPCAGKSKTPKLDVDGLYPAFHIILRPPFKTTTLGHLEL